MSSLSIAWRNLMNRRVQTLITILVIAVGVAMTISIMILGNGIKVGIKEATEPYGMIVGSKGSANQLVFNTIFLIDNPLTNISLHYFEELEQDERVDLAVPFALGDNYKGYRIVGTSEAFFTLKATPVDPDYFQVKKGTIFNESFEAVLGASVAKDTGLKIGDTFTSGHGVVQALEEDHSHTDHPYKVVGIMEAKNAPADKGIYVSMDSYWISHDQDDHHEDEHAEEMLAAAGEHDHDAEPGVTAALIKPKSYNGLMQLYQEINNGKVAQAVFPGQVIAKVFDMMGSGEQLLKMISYVVLGLSALTTILSLYSSTMERRRTISILRAMGANRNVVFGIVILESILVMFIGALCGVVLSYGLSYVLGRLIMANSSIAVAFHFSIDHLLIVLGVSLMGVAAGFVPAVSAYRTETAKYLSANH